jgi:hypothetical protein
VSTQTIFRTVGSTSQMTMVNLVQNAASTAPGDPILGLAYNTANLVCYYKIDGTGTLTAVALATLANDTAAYSSGGFVQVSAANAPGMYRFDIPAAVLASAGEANIIFSGIPAGTVGNMETHTVKVIVTALDFYTACGAIYTTAPAESYAALSTVPTLAQFMCATQQFLQNFSITGTTLTMNNIVAGTAQQTYTLNSSSNPTGIVRAT